MKNYTKIVNAAKTAVLVSLMNLAVNSHANVVTLRFNMADLLDEYSTGGLMSAVDNPRRVFYKDSSLSDNYNTWGATYENSAVGRYEPNDPDFPTAFGNYQSWLNTNPGVGVFNLSLRPYEGSRAWGQQLMLANPPTDWTSGTDAEAATYFTTSAAPGWESYTRWNAWAGPVVGFYASDPNAILEQGMADAWFEITGDFLMDTDYDGVADTVPQLGDSMRFWTGSFQDQLTTTDAEWTALGVTGLERPLDDPQLNGVITAQVIPEPSGILLVVIGSGAIFYGRRYRFI